MKKKLLIFLSLFVVFMTTSCRFMTGLFGSSTEKFLVGNRKVIEAQHDLWFGPESKSDSRSIFSIVTKGTEGQLEDNMDYAAENNWITGLKYYPNGCKTNKTEDFSTLPEYFTEDMPVLIITMNNGQRYLIDIAGQWIDYLFDNKLCINNTPEKFDFSSVMFGVANLGCTYAPGIMPNSSGSISNISFPDKKNFMFKWGFFIMNDFPYPMYVKFDSRNTELHRNEEEDCWYWGVEFSGIESETYPTVEIMDITTYLEWISTGDNNHINLSEYDYLLKEADKMDIWPF